MFSPLKLEGNVLTPRLSSVFSQLQRPETYTDKHYLVSTYSVESQVSNDTPLTNHHLPYKA